MTPHRARAVAVGAALLAAAGLAACGGDGATPDAEPLVFHRLRVPAPAGDVAALYGEIEDRSGAGDRLLAVTSPDAEHVMLHRTVAEGGRVRMTSVPDGIAIPPGGRVALEPGGLHVMLHGLREPLARGDQVDVALEFERAGSIALRAPVTAAAE